MEKEIKSCYWFLFYRDKLLLEKKDSAYIIPFQEESPFEVKYSFEVKLDQSLPARAASLDEEIEETDKYVMIGLRASWDYLPLDWYKRAGKAHQLVHWDRHSQFCPACGTRLVWNTLISKRCEICNHEYYPTISPAMIVLIRRGEEVLLVHARNFKKNFYGLVAGFLEVGETIEQCVRREVYEETGLKIKNISYFGSQPWPYPSGIMVGFFADYESGEIKFIDGELSRGSFFTKDNLPVLPDKLSIARRMIDWWIAGEPEEKPEF